MSVGGQSTPIRLDKAFTRGYVKTITLTMGGVTSYTPSQGKACIVLTGVINHITGTVSVLGCYDGITATIFNLTRIESAVANGAYPAYPTKSGDYVGQQAPLNILGEKDYVAFTGGANSSAVVKILEWQL